MWEDDMADAERRGFRRGVVAGAMLGLAIGLLLALFVTMRPGLFAALIE
jgi:hypothetical protein